MQLNEGNAQLAPRSTNLTRPLNHCRPTSIAMNTSVQYACAIAGTLQSSAAFRSGGLSRHPATGDLLRTASTHALSVGTGQPALFNEAKVSLFQKSPALADATPGDFWNKWDLSLSLKSAGCPVPRIRRALTPFVTNPQWPGAVTSRLTGKQRWTAACRRLHKHMHRGVHCNRSWAAMIEGPSEVSERGANCALPSLSCTITTQKAE